MEKWKPVPSYKEFYEASNLGRIRSLRLRGKILNPEVSRGYKRIVLFYQGISKKFLVHRIIAETFIGPRPAKYEVNHKNGKKLDNRPHNLEYVTRSQNHKHAYAHLGKISQKGIKHGRHKLTNAQVLTIRRMRKHGYSIIQVQRVVKCCPATVSLITNRKIWRHI